MVILVAEPEPAAGPATPRVHVAVAADHDHVLVAARYREDVHAQQRLHQLGVIVKESKLSMVARRQNLIPSFPDLEVRKGSNFAA